MTPRPVTHSENRFLPSLTFSSDLVESPILTVSIQSPKRGPVWIGVDWELQMYYWQENQAPFVYSKPWELTLPVSKVVRPLSDWIISKFNQGEYHAHFVGRLLTWVNEASRDFDLSLQFRCGTATPKGQWLISTVRCESIITTARLSLPPSVEAEVREFEGSDRVVQLGDCAGQDDDFVLVAPPSEHPV